MPDPLPRFCALVRGRTSMVAFRSRVEERSSKAPNRLLLLVEIRFRTPPHFVPTSLGADIVSPDIATILGRHTNDRTELMDILWEIQHAYGYIPPEAAQQVAGWLGVTYGDVVETATFYHFFHTTPSGRYRIYLSNTAIAKPRGYLQIYDTLERETGARFDGPASPDFGLFETACIGLSDQEPAM